MIVRRTILTVNVLIDSISVDLRSTLDASPRPQETGLHVLE